jgi:hypothetical protein
MHFLLLWTERFVQEHFDNRNNVNSNQTFLRDPTSTALVAVALKNLFFFNFNFLLIAKASVLNFNPLIRCMPSRSISVTANLHNRR